MRRLILIIGLGVIATSTFSQRIINPAYGLQSHETMKITEVNFTEKATIISVSLENRTAGGYFCVDPNTYMICPDGARIKLVRAEGIPSCPEVYRFTGIGEVLSFRLYFARPDSVPEWFNLIEDCESNCFSVYAVNLNVPVNQRVDMAYLLAESAKPGEAAMVFEEIISELEKRNHGLLGSLYSSLVTMKLREGNEAQARLWYGKMLESGAPELKFYVENLASRGIKW